MKNAASFRITSLTCFYFSIVCLLPFFHTWSWLPAVTTILILVFSLIAAHVKPPAIRLLLSVFPFAAAVYACLVPKDYILAVICALPAVMSAILLAVGSDATPLYRFRREFYVFVLLSVLITAMSVNPLLFSWPTFVYLGACMIFGILMLRAGRAGQTSSFRWQLGSAGLFLLPVAASAIVGVGLMLGFDWLVKWLAPFFYDEGVEAVRTSPSPIYVDSNLHSKVEFAESQSTAVPLLLETDPPKGDIHIRNSTLNWIWIAIGVFVIAACALLIYFLTRSKDKDLTEQEKLDLSLENEVTSFFSLRKNDIPEDDFNRAKIRELYRRYLQYLRTRGVAIVPSETTIEISDSAASVTKDDTELRTIYRLSRYDRETPITDEDVKFAEESFLRLTAAPKEDDPSAPPEKTETV